MNTFSSAVPSKSAWARGPPRTILATSSSQQPPRPPSATPGAAANLRSTHPRRSRAPAEGVSIQHGLSVPRSTSAAKPVTFGSIDDAPTPTPASLLAWSRPPKAVLSAGKPRARLARSTPHPQPPRTRAGSTARTLAPVWAPRAAPIAADVVPQGAGHAMPAEQLIPCVLEWDQHAEQGPLLPPHRNTASPSYAANATVRPGPSPRRLSAHAPAFVPSELEPSLEYRVHAGPAAVTRPLSAPRTPSALATARFIDDIKAIPYPAGVRRPLAALNRNAQKGKFRYDRAFLLQFASLCVDMPDGLPAALDALRLAPRT
ncbi:hypothetical protein HETIRDRAFT_456359 [Heterobasidion irregulare TC 32-1]|uniref:Eukaryotic translation initiation factor 4G1 eIF4E-binding domain-containing protein n=1 Tax=Heterobasidion irregulare (strain TC 32-1) TaxID=747525 RepID=W4JMR1_HETIT|nr:uncharacterized protein HETIRDRAFT_456359 [Heterobasidion irregulare TC 32-1]ETW74837.1 hypothetical protein HETIRDRAFT_456359 [Heterobasidion irregulare TC 32-1]